MSKIKSLHYLLLDEINKRKNNSNCQAIEEIQKKLNIKKNEDGFKLDWSLDNKNFNLSLKNDDFEFYTKNDLDEPTIKKSLEYNNKNAEKTVNKILKLSSINEEKENFMQKKFISLNFYKFFFFFLVFAITATIKENTLLYPMLTIFLFIIGDSFKNINIFIFLTLCLIPSLILPNIFIFIFLLLLFPLILIYNFKANNFLVKFLFSTIIIFNFYKIDFNTIIFNKFNLIIFIISISAIIKTFLKINSNMFAYYGFAFLPLTFALNNLYYETVVYSILSLVFIDLINYLEKSDFFKINTSRKFE